MLAIGSAIALVYWTRPRAAQRPNAEHDREAWAPASTNYIVNLVYREVGG